MKEEIFDIKYTLFQKVRSYMYFNYKQNLFSKLSFHKILIVTFLSCLILMIPDGAGQAGRAGEFYLASDRSFGPGEEAYVNLEGPGSAYEFRIYQIEDPESYMIKRVKERLVKEENDSAFANPFAVFMQTMQFFRNDMRALARKQFNSSNRSSLREAMALADVPVEESFDLPSARLLKNYKYISSFIVESSGSGWIYRRVPVPVPESGLFLIEAVKGKHVAHTLLNRSSIQFAVKQSDDETLVIVADRDSGEPVSSAKVSLYDAAKGDSVCRSSTAADGIASCKNPVREKSLILVSKNGEYSISDPDFYASSFYGKGGNAAYIYTDRPVYRPGDTLFFKGILRQFKNDSYSVTGGEGSIAINDPSGKVVIKDISVSLNSGGTFHGEATLPKGDVALGTYEAVLKYKDKSYKTEFQVEAYRKPPYYVNISIPEKHYFANATIPVTVKASYHYGKNLSGDEIKVMVFRKPRYTRSPVGTLNYTAMQDYLTKGEDGEQRELVEELDGKLSNKGEFTFQIKTPKIKEDYDYSVNATVVSGDYAISGGASIAVTRSAYYMKIHRESQVYETGEKAKFTVELVPFKKQTDGDAGIRNKKIKAVLYTRSFRNISEEAERKEVDSDTESTDEKGKAVFSFRLSQKGHYIIEASYSDTDGNETKSQTALWSSLKEDSIQIPFKDIALTSSKDVYEPGESAEILLVSPVSDGTVYLSVEGNRIYSASAVKMKGNVLRYKIPIRPELVPNFTLSAFQFSGNKIFKNQIRVVAPPVDKFIQVSAAAVKKVYKPGDQAEIVVQTLDYKGKPLAAEVSLSVVDEAIYQIQEDRQIPLATFFYHPRRNNVETTFSASYRFFGYSEEKRMQLAMSGKSLASLKGEEPTVRDRFKDTAFWNAVVKTSGDGKASVRFQLPDNLTSWRVTARAITEDTKVGQSRSNFIARKDLMIRAGLPRYLTSGSRQFVSASVANLTKEKLETTLTIKTSLKVEGSNIQKLTIPAGSSVTARFEVQASSSMNKADITFEAVAGEINDAVKETVPVKVYGRNETSAVTMKFTDSVKTDLIAPNSSSNHKISFTLTPNSGEALRQSLGYLAGYPYGCVEQTMSRFMPLLAVKKIGFISPEIERELPMMLSTGLQNLKSMQNRDGGFGWFGQNRLSDAMMTAYVYRGLSLSKKYGAGIEPYVLGNTRQFLYKVYGSGKLNAFEKVYILFSLSEEKAVEASMLSAMAREEKNLTVYGKALLALAYLNSGDKAKASSIYQNIKMYKSSKNIEEEWKDDSVETQAGILLLGVRLKDDKRILKAMEESLLVMRSGIAWKNSRDTAMSVLALAELVASENKKGEVRFSVLLNGKEIRKFTISNEKLSREELHFTVPATVSNKIEIKKSGEGSAIISASLSYFHVAPNFTALDSGMSVERSYYRMQSDGNTLTPVASTAFKPGELILCELRYKKNGAPSSYVMIEDFVPPGFSIEKRDSEFYSGSLKMEYSSRNYYDDRAVFFVDQPVSSGVIRYFLRAEIPGSYRVLPAHASLMYYPAKNGSSADQELRVE